MGSGELEPRLRTLADSVPVLLWMADEDGRCVFFNRRWLDFTGRSLAQAMGDGWAESVHPDDVEQCLATFHRARELRQPFENEYRLRRADGTWRWILDQAVPLAGDDGLGGYIGSGVDLTERHEADAALRRSREDRAAAMAVGRMGTFDLDLATGRIRRDRNLEELYGIEPGSADTLGGWAALIHPDDRAGVLAQVERAATEGGEYRLEHRHLHPDGRIRWLERRGEAYRDRSGRIAGVRGIVIDVTERKVAELERAVLFERVTRLQEVTAALARAGDPDQVLQIMIDQGLAAMGASAGSVAVLDAGAGVLEVTTAGGYDPHLVDRFRRFGLGEALPLAEAARTAAPVACPDLERWTQRYPHLAAHPSQGRHVAAAALPMLVDERVIGAVGLSFDEPQDFDEAQMDFLAAVVAQCAQALDRTWSYTAEAAARRAAEEAQARLALLAEASSMLAGSLEYEATMPAVARLAVPLLGDCCVVDVFEPEWRRVAAIHVDPRVEACLRAAPPAAWVPDDSAERAAALDALGLGAALVEPFEARGRTLGMLGIGRRTPGPFSEADRSVVAGLVTRIAQALDNAMLYRAEHQAHEAADTSARRLRFLLEVSTSLAAPLPLDRRLELLAYEAAMAVADVCLVDLVERDGSIRRVAAATADADLRPATQALRRLMHSDPQSRHPSAAAIRSGRTQLCADLTEDRLRAITTGPAHLEAARQLDAISYVAVPLRATDRVLGAITLITTGRSQRRYGEDDVVLAEDMAKRVALGLETASMHDEMRRIAQTLQASLLPSAPPEIPGIEVGTRYVAAGEGNLVGGDFFDVFAVGPDSWNVVVGDVCGQGVDAATVTGLARHTVRSSALEHESPAAVLSHLNHILLRTAGDGAGETDPRFCTVCLCRLHLDRRGASVTLALGGHPLPYVLRADGAVRQVGQPGSLLGVVEGAIVCDEEHRLGPGDALVLYTDGITERHHGQDFFGEDRVRQTLQAAVGLTADEIAGRLEQAARRFVDGQPNDDMAVVVVRVPPG
jgi:PAS domain S-box-containing protein